MEQIFEAHCMSQVGRLGKKMQVGDSDLVLCGLRLHAYFLWIEHEADLLP